MVIIGTRGGGGGEECLGLILLMFARKFSSLYELKFYFLANRSTNWNWVSQNCSLTTTRTLPNRKMSSAHVWAVCSHPLYRKLSNFPTRFQCPNLDWNFKICGTKFGLNLDLRKNDYFIKNALPWRNVKISMIQVNFGKVWPSLILLRTDTIFSSFGTRVFLEVLVPKLEKVVTVRTKFRLGHSFSKLAWIREIFTQRHGNAFLLEWSFLLKFKISPNLVLKILKFQSKFGHRNRVRSVPQKVSKRHTDWSRSLFCHQSMTWP